MPPRGKSIVKIGAVVPVPLPERALLEMLDTLQV